MGLVNCYRKGLHKNNEKESNSLDAIARAAEGGMSMSVVVKIWLTLAVLFPIALGVRLIDDGDTILSAIATAEMLSFLAFSVGMAINLIWSMRRRNE